MPQLKLEVRSTAREQMIDITGKVGALVQNVAAGVVHLWSMHTTCALTVNEGADPDVQRDILAFMKRMVPQHADFRHAEGNSDAHLKTSMFGPGLTLLISQGRLVLGRWQHVFVCEWDGPRTREIVAQIIAEDVSHVNES